MINTNRIFFSPRYQDLINDLKDLEKTRIYCGHDLNHFLSVARIAYILCLENNIKVNKDLIYTTALLHDIGRVHQYRYGKDHAKASYEIAKDFLSETTFTEDEKDTILEAIKNHRKKSDSKDFASIFYKADKLSRPCFACPARPSCNWPEEKMNLKIKY